MDGRCWLHQAPTDQTPKGEGDEQVLFDREIMVTLAYPDMEWPAFDSALATSLCRASEPRLGSVINPPAATPRAAIRASYRICPTACGHEEDNNIDSGYALLLVARKKTMTSPVDWRAQGCSMRQCCSAIVGGCVLECSCEMQCWECRCGRRRIGIQLWEETVLNCGCGRRQYWNTQCWSAVLECSCGRRQCWTRAVGGCNVGM